MSDYKKNEKRKVMMKKNIDKFYVNNMPHQSHHQALPSKYRRSTQ